MPNLMTIGRYGGSPSRRGGSIPVPRVWHESIYRDVYMPSRMAFDGSKFHRLSGDRFETASAGQAVLRPRPDPQQRVHPRASRRSRYSGGSRASRAADAASTPGDARSQWLTSLRSLNGMSPVLC